MKPNVLVRIEYDSYENSVVLPGFLLCSTGSIGDGKQECLHDDHFCSGCSFSVLNYLVTLEMRIIIRFQYLLSSRTSRLLVVP